MNLYNLLLITCFVMFAEATYKPLDFDDSDYYLTLDTSAAPQAMIEGIKRGHEGLLVKVQQLGRALKEDEVKMNNVFYQLGQHNNDLKSLSTFLHKMADSTRNTDAKINRQSYNVDTLRQNVDKVTKSMLESKKKDFQIDVLQNTVSDLEFRLSKAFSRLDLLEKLSPGEQKIKENSVYYSSRAPTEVMKAVTEKESCPTGWTVAGNGCYWVSGEEANFVSAVAACVKMGAKLSGLPPKVNLGALRKFMLKDKNYWTSATNAYSASQQWSYLMTGDQLPNSSWENGAPWKSRNLHCAVLAKSGLVATRCSKRYKYICESET